MTHQEKGGHLLVILDELQVSYAGVHLHLRHNTPLDQVDYLDFTTLQQAIKKTGLDDCHKTYYTRHETYSA